MLLSNFLTVHCSSFRVFSKGYASGKTYLIRPDQAISHQYNTIAISNFAVDSAGIYGPPLTDVPNLRFNVQGELVPGNLLPNPGVGGIDQLEALLSKREVNFQYASQTPMSTSVAITFPTKWFHYTNTASTFYNVGATWPYQSPFTGYCEVTGDCSTGTGGGEVIAYSIWDRNETQLATLTSITGPPRLPYEVNVVGLSAAANPPVIFRNNVVISTSNLSSGQTFYSGRGKIDLSPWPPYSAGDPRVAPQGEDGYRGLPAISVVMTEEFFADNVSVEHNAICGGYTPCFPSIQAAIDSSSTGTRIRISQETYNEDVVLNVTKVLTLQGGWNSTFTAIQSNTTINGSLTVSDGTLIVENIILQ